MTKTITIEILGTPVDPNHEVVGTKKNIIFHAYKGVVRLKKEEFDSKFQDVMDLFEKTYPSAVYPKRYVSVT